jgi:hypothetical protein
MEINDIVSASLAGFAIVLSCFALFFSWKFGRTQNKVNLILLEENEVEKSAQKRAYIQHELDSNADRQRFNLINRGHSEARNVNIEFVGDNDLIIESEIRDKLPVIKLEPGDSISMIAAISGSNKPQQEINIFWDDDSGKGNKRHVIVSVFG